MEIDPVLGLRIVKIDFQRNLPLVGIDEGEQILVQAASELRGFELEHQT